MITEQELREKLKAAGQAMPLRTVPYEQVLRRARPERRRFLAVLVAAAVVVAGLSIIGGIRIAGMIADRDRGGPIDPADRGDGPTRERIKPVLDTFVNGLRDERAAATWDLLTPRAREAIGDLDSWRTTMNDVEYLFTWIGRRPLDVYVTPLPGSAAIVTAAERQSHEGAWLLTTFPVRDVSGEVLIDLDVRRSVSLEPESPLFEASVPCSPEADDCPSVEDLRPTISTGQTFSVFLDPATEVDEVWFSVDGGSWITRADLAPVEGGVRATARFDGADLPSESVFVVAISRPDGGFDSYGYRVVYEQ